MRDGGRERRGDGGRGRNGSCGITATHALSGSDGTSWEATEAGVPSWVPVRATCL